MLVRLPTHICVTRPQWVKQYCCIVIQTPDNNMYKFNRNFNFSIDNKCFNYVVCNAATIFIGHPNLSRRRDETRRWMFPPKIYGTLIEIHYTQVIKMHTIHALTCCWIWLFKRRRIRYENINRSCVFTTRIWHTHSETKRNKSACILYNILTTRQNGHRFADDIYKCIFLNGNSWISIKLTLKLVPRGPINIVPVLVQIMAWRQPGVHYQYQWWLDHRCILYMRHSA